MIELPREAIMLGHACETLATVMYLQRGPPSAENKPTTQRTNRTLYMLAWPCGQSLGLAQLGHCFPKFLRQDNFLTVTMTVPSVGIQDFNDR